MFNIFINGIVETLQDENSDPVLIGNTSINTLLYADDLVLLSSSPQGLQNCLGISCEKSRFYAKKTYFFPILGGGRAPGASTPWIRPCTE
jgi:hypothetical protein